MKKPLQIIFSLVFIIVCLLITRTIVSNRIATSGELLGQISEKANVYKTQNALIGEELYSILSLTNLTKEASKLGFVNQVNTLSLSQSLPLAAKQ